MLINPYSSLGTKIKSALDYIIANLPLNPTFDNLNEALYNGIFQSNPPNEELTVVYIKSILPNVYNSYIIRSVTLSLPERTSVQAGVVEGPLSKTYNETQQLIISLLLNGLKTTQPENIPAFLGSVEEKIAASGLSIVEQTPLFIATATGKAVYEYWMLNIPQPSSWAAYMVITGITPQAMDAVNYANTGNRVSAAIQGVLLSWGSIYLPKVEFVDMMSAVIGATGLAAGKVVFKW